MQCLHCHGLEGNGRGPTGPWLNPPPRDYRLGIFKYTSSTQDQNARKPRRDDILHVLAFGIEGTSMPSFNVLSIEEREAIASYVIHLSLRGEVEGQTMTDQMQIDGREQRRRAGGPKYRMLVREDLKNPTMKDAMQDNLALAAARWVAAQKPDAEIKPGPYSTGASDEDVPDLRRPRQQDLLRTVASSATRTSAGSRTWSTTPGARSSAAGTSTRASTAAAGGRSTCTTASTAASKAPACRPTRTSRAR